MRDLRLILRLHPRQRRTRVLLHIRDRAAAHGVALESRADDPGVLDVTFRGPPLEVEAVADAVTDWFVWTRTG